MKVYVVISGYNYEGYSSPDSAHATMASAEMRKFMIETEDIFTAPDRVDIIEMDVVQ